MALSSRLSPLLLWLLISGQVLGVPGLKFGINYGQIANDLPTPARVAGMLQSLNVSKVKLYDADPRVLSAFANTGVEFIIAIDNGNVANMTDASRARSWLAQHVQPFLPQTRISCITVGNEVLSGSDTALMSNLLPAMQAMYQALSALGLSGQVNVSTAHSLAVLSTSFPPSAGAFRADLAEYMQPLLNFHAQIKSPFLVNAYPFFAYKADPSAISLPYVLFEPNAGVTDPSTNLTYDNMLYAQLDAVHAAMRSMGHADDVDVRVSETGWPSKGDADEPGATVANAAAYNGNLMKRIAEGQGTPMRPAVPIDVYVFALFNEDQKPGPTSERNYGLFYPDGTPVYNIGLLAGSPSSSPPSSFLFSSSSPPDNKLPLITSWLCGILILSAVVILL